MPDEALDHLAYFEWTWVGATVGGRRVDAHFRSHSWNQYNATLAGLARTNNSSTRWHRAFQTSVGCSHPTIWKCIDAIKPEVSLVDFCRNQAIAREEPPRQKYEKHKQRIRNLVSLEVRSRQCHPAVSQGSCP